MTTPIERDRTICVIADILSQRGIISYLDCHFAMLEVRPECSILVANGTVAFIEFRGFGNLDLDTATVTFCEKGGVLACRGGEGLFAGLFGCHVGGWTCWVLTSVNVRFFR